MNLFIKLSLVTVVLKHQYWKCVKNTYFGQNKWFLLGSQVPRVPQVPQVPRSVVPQISDTPVRGISAIYTGWPEPIPGKDLLATVFLLLLWSICRLHLLFLRLQTFWFRNNRIHGISISKGMIIYSENGILMVEVTWELLRLPTGSQETVAGSRVGFLAKRTRIGRIPSKPYSVHSVHSAIGRRMNGMIFNTFRKPNRSQRNTNTVYSEYSYSRIVPNCSCPKRTCPKGTFSHVSDFHSFLRIPN